MSSALSMRTHAHHHVYTHTHVYKHTYIHARTHAHERTYTHTHTLTQRTHTSIRTYAHARTHTHAHARTAYMYFIYGSVLWCSCTDLHRVVCSQAYFQAWYICKDIIGCNAAAPLKPRLQPRQHNIHRCEVFSVLCSLVFSLLNPFSLSHY